MTLATEISTPPALPRQPPLAALYAATRQRSRQLTETLSAEDQCLQSMTDASPVKWHLAHTTWFFETFLLVPHAPGYRLFDADYPFLFNSYYEAAGPRHQRPLRGMLSRPSVAEVGAYRDHVDDAMTALLAGAGDDWPSQQAALPRLGINHEQQHQELLLTDILHAFSLNPLRPAVRPRATAGQAAPKAPPLQWCAFDEGLYEIGHAGDGFAFDNEGPRHRQHLQAFSLASRLVNCGEYRAFIDDGGYAEPLLWLSDGWATAREEGWQAPLYWYRQDDRWWHHGLDGCQPVEDGAPVTHLSYYEADAFARWAGKRLPTEGEWEVAAPAPGLQQMFGACWQWTASPYAPYPGFRPTAGAIGEYNGKFMCNQMVLKGSSRVTATGHARPTYRNFFYPHQRWQFTGIRLAA